MSLDCTCTRLKEAEEKAAKWDALAQTTHACPCGAQRTCQLEPQKSGKRRCKRCGAFVSTDAVWDCFGAIAAKYCPNCGAKVVEE
jgi:hypothetical protein